MIRTDILTWSLPSKELAQWTKLLHGLGQVVCLEIRIFLLTSRNMESETVEKRQVTATIE